jgi:hypothetical protein
MKNNQAVVKNAGGTVGMPAVHPALILLEIVPAVLNLGQSVIHYMTRRAELAQERYVISQRTKIMHHQISATYKAFCYNLDAITSTHQRALDAARQNIMDIRSNMDRNQEIFIKITESMLDISIPLPEKTLYHEHSKIVANMITSDSSMIQLILQSNNETFNQVMTKLENPKMLLPNAEVMG